MTTRRKPKTSNPMRRTIVAACQCGQVKKTKIEPRYGVVAFLMCQFIDFPVHIIVFISSTHSVGYICVLVCFPKIQFDLHNYGKCEMIFFFKYFEYANGLHIGIAYFRDGICIFWASICFFPIPIFGAVRRPTSPIDWP